MRFGHLGKSFANLPVSSLVAAFMMLPIRVYVSGNSEEAWQICCFSVGSVNQVFFEAGRKCDSSVRLVRIG